MVVRQNGGMAVMAGAQELTGGAPNLPAQGLGLIRTHAVPLFPATRSGQQPGIVLATRLRKVQGTQHRAPPVPACQVPGVQPADEDDACWGQHGMPSLLTSQQPDMTTEVAIPHPDLRFQLMKAGLGYDRSCVFRAHFFSSFCSVFAAFFPNKDWVGIFDLCDRGMMDRGFICRGFPYRPRLHM